MNISDQILLLTGEARAICTDEREFFDNRLIDMAGTLANGGKRRIMGEQATNERRVRHYFRSHIEIKRGKAVQPLNPPAQKV